MKNKKLTNIIGANAFCNSGLKIVSYGEGSLIRIFEDISFQISFEENERFRELNLQIKPISALLGRVYLQGIKEYREI